ncbi:vitelline membrane outer layer protein 1 homolog [Carassius auratus]|uniref:Vitelline membrane outer layer protein 1 homolog n=1 Tax=Carassius auratus TaxID=7957 RepID=A0A6P6IYG9_CARAU|nr:vitelline membrane outer layer protein 1 homolog [Carassius auratus]
MTQLRKTHCNCHHLQWLRAHGHVVQWHLLTVPNGGGLGSWGQRDMCPAGTYTAGFSLRVEDPVGHDADTALNVVRFHCIASKALSDSYHDYFSLLTDVGRVRWTEIKRCPSGFLTAFQLRVESCQGDGDDTAAKTSCEFMLLCCAEKPLT